MDQSHIDDIFKAGLKEHQTPIDNDALWTAINKPSSKKRGYVYLKLLSLAIVAISLASALLFIGTSDKTSIHTTENFSSTNTEALSASENSSQIKENDSDKLQKNTSTPADKESNLPQDKINGAKNSPIANRGKKQSESIKDRSNLKSSQGRSTIKNKSTPISDDMNETHTTDEITQIYTHRSSDSHQLTKKNKTIANQKTNANLAPSSTIVQQQPHLLKKINALDSETGYLIYNRDKIENNKKVECYSYSKKPAMISIETYGIVDFVLPSMSAESDVENYLSERKESQTQLEGYRAGLRLKYKLPNSIYIKAGMEYGHLRERFSKETSSTITEILPDQLLEIIEKNDTTIYIYGDAPVTTISTKKWRVNNSYKTLGVPVLIGYDYHGRKLTYGIELGAIYNFHYCFDGYLLNNASEPEPVKDYFKSSINTSITGGVTLNYFLNKHFDFFIQSSFLHNLNNINSTTNLVNQKNTRIGVGAGISYKLN